MLSCDMTNNQQLYSAFMGIVSWNILDIAGLQSMVHFFGIISMLNCDFCRYRNQWMRERTKLGLKQQVLRDFDTKNIGIEPGDLTDFGDGLKAGENTNPKI